MKRPINPSSRKPPVRDGVAPKRVTLVLRVDLASRVLEKAAVLQQNPNNFINLCVEGMLEAMDTKEHFDPPILGLYNRTEERSLLSVKSVLSIVSAFVPEVSALNEQELQFFLTILGKHDGQLNADVIQGYCKMAARMNLERIAHEKELRKLLGRAV